ncbi:unnamed protein product [Rotaria socialis]|uniref:Protein-serine/threonine kinase n=1 Tax=Rotaria socialis TaxID=392032 RepID=A0A818EQE0_9BILA|nr:unnamed protein product [Rotaria socialis]
MASTSGKRCTLSIEQKLEILEALKSKKPDDVAKDFNIGYFTVKKIRQNEDEAGISYESILGVSHKDALMHLSMSRLYARYFNGDLEIHSIDGHGTDAYIYLQAVEDQASEWLPICNRAAYEYYVSPALGFLDHYTESSGVIRHDADDILLGRIESVDVERGEISFLITLDSFYDNILIVDDDNSNDDHNDDDDDDDDDTFTAV